MFVDFQNVFSVVCLEKEANGDDIAPFQLVKISLDERLWEGKTFHHLLRGLRALRAQHLDDFDPQCFLRIAQGTLLPRGGFGTVKGRGNFVRQTFGVQFEEVFDLFAASHRKAPKGAVDFRHVGGKPFPVQFFLTRPVNLCDLP